MTNDLCISVAVVTHNAVFEAASTDLIEHTNDLNDYSTECENGDRDETEAREWPFLGITLLVSETNETIARASFMNMSTQFGEETVEKGRGGSRDKNEAKEEQ